MTFDFDRNEQLAIAGLSAPASINIDRSGVPHIRAGSLDDLWFMQGFNAARDRLWQIDIWRKRGLGLLAKDFGPGYIEQDRASRMFLYRGDMNAEWSAYADDARNICERFAAGVNAYVALTERDPQRLPPEFALVKARPARWSAEDIVRIRSHGLSRQAISKVVRARVVSQAGVQVDDLRRKRTPQVEPTRFADIAYGDIPLVVVDDMKLAIAHATFTPERLSASLQQAGAWRAVNDFSEVIEDATWQGSNNWVVAARLSGTGKPLLASDPHRAHSLPSLRYLVHLTAPGFDAIGAGEPGVPGISLGHNGDIAFGLTIFGADQEEVYVYETHPDDPDLYRHGDAWERMRIVDEVIPVRGEADQHVSLRFTRHGPVTFAEPENHRAFAVRSVWFEPGGAPYLASLTCMRTRDLDGFRAGNARWGAPSINHLYADQTGTIAWMPGGKVPRRVGWNGLLPVPGDGRCEWEGFLAAKDYPERIDPASGYLYTANEMNLPPDWAHDENPIGFDWTDRSRADRIAEVLSTSKRHGIAEACALQTDETSAPAQKVLALLAGLETDDADAREALALLRMFDGTFGSESAAAALYEVWLAKHLRAAVFRAAAGGSAIAALLAPGDHDALVAALQNPDDLLGGRAKRDALLVETLSSAMATCRALMGEDASSWAWGRLHHGAFPHPLASVSGDAPPGVGPLPIGGSGSTVKLASYRPSDFRVMHGASFRMIVDLSDFDRSLCVNAPGQSGDPRSAHYDRLAPVWARSEYAPMLYTREAIDEATEFVWRLTPG